MFRQLVLAQIIEPVSELDSLRVLKEIGVSPPIPATDRHHGHRRTARLNRRAAPISVWIGTRHLLYPDALRPQQRAAAGCTQLRLTVCEDAIYVYPLVPVPEGRCAVHDIVQEITA